VKRYDRIPLWETKRRLAVLERFYSDVGEYFSNSRADWKVDGRIEKEAARAARKRINLSLQKARRIIATAGVGTVITYTPPPAVGGYRQQVDIIHNLFTIGQFHIAPDTPLGMIEQALGVYTADLSASRWRTFNPLWWIGNLLTWFSSIPFLLLGKVGFDGDKAQHSLIGKLVSLVFLFIPVIASILTILDLMDLLEPLKATLRGGA
jgi:hypothetical protein